MIESRHKLKSMHLCWGLCKSCYPNAIIGTELGKEESAFFACIQLQVCYVHGRSFACGWPKGDLVNRNHLFRVHVIKFEGYPALSPGANTFSLEKHLLVRELKTQ